MAGDEGGGPLGFGPEDEQDDAAARAAAERRREEREAARGRDEAADRAKQTRDAAALTGSRLPRSRRVKAPVPTEREPRPDERAKRRGPNTTAYVGLAALLLIGIIAVTSFLSGDKGPSGVEVGKPAPQFAAPIVLSALAGDANIALPGKTSKSAGSVPACAVHKPDRLTSCDEYRTRPAVFVFFFGTRGKACLDQVDRVDALARRQPDVAFAAISVGGDRKELRDLVRRRGWKIPVAVDQDGTVGSLYGAVVCPQLTFIRRGGLVADTSLKAFDDAELRRRVALLLRPPPPGAAGS